MIGLAWWVALAGLWPLADPGHGGGSLLSRFDLALHLIAVVPMLAAVALLGLGTALALLAWSLLALVLVAEAWR